jgi:murein L,D-transpeptidase YcbB/YkuD
MNFCKYCGARSVQGAVYCNGCGKPFSTSSDVTQQSASAGSSPLVATAGSGSSPQPPRRGSKTSLIVAGVAVTAAAVVGFVFVTNSGSAEQAATKDPVANSSPVVPSASATGVAPKVPKKVKPIAPLPEVASSAAERAGASCRGMAGSGLSMGSSGDAVVAVQRVLRSLGYTGTSEETLVLDDGQYGNHTRYAVEKYQRANGLTVDGVVGPVTWTDMGAEAYC